MIDLPILPIDQAYTEDNDDERFTCPMCGLHEVDEEGDFCDDCADSLENDQEE